MSNKEKSDGIVCFVCNNHTSQQLNGQRHMIDLYIQKDLIKSDTDEHGHYYLCPVCKALCFTYISETSFEAFFWRDFAPDFFEAISSVFIDRNCSVHYKKVMQIMYNYLTFSKEQLTIWTPIIVKQSLNYNVHTSKETNARDMIKMVISVLLDSLGSPKNVNIEAEMIKRVEHRFSINYDDKETETVRLL